jgi:acyl carrier protein
MCKLADFNYQNWTMKLTKDISNIDEDVLKVPAGTITEDTMIEDVEQWDSLAHVMIIGQLEEELGISIPLDEAIELKGMRELLEKAGCE